MKKNVLVSLLMLTAAGLASGQSSPYFQAITNLHPTAYWPMHGTAPGVPGDIETNYGSLGALGTAYYAQWAAGTNVTDYTNQVPGAIGGGADSAVAFSGSGASYLLVPRTSPSLSLTPPFTIECWANPRSSDATYGDMISDRGTLQNSGGTSGTKAGVSLLWEEPVKSPATFAFAAFVGDGSGQTEILGPTGPAMDTWHHVVLTCDAATNWTLYVDGNVAQSQALPYVPAPWNPLTIGAGYWHDNGPVRRFHGGLDEVAIYTNALDAATVSTHYQDGINGTVGQYEADVSNAHPQLFYRMDAPAYAPPATNTWPVMASYGTAAANGVYAPGLAPGSVAGPTHGGMPVAGLDADNAVAFNGISAYAEVDAPGVFNVPYNEADPSNDTPFTVSAWFKGNPTDPRFQSIVSAGNDSWSLRMTRFGDLHLYTDDSHAAELAGPPVNDGQWHQVVATHAGNVDTMYLDGALAAIATNSAFTNGPGSTNGTVLIGSDPDNVNGASGVGEQFAGAICDVAFWNGTALDASQVTALYSAAGVAPFIQTQPVSASVNQGSGFTNTVVATGSAPLHYQWYQDGAPRSGQTNASLVLKPVQASDESPDYYAVITNSYGSVTSSVVSLTVNTSPIIVSQFPVPYTNLITIFAGASPTISLQAVGTHPLHYIWTTNGAVVADATNASFTLSNAQPGSVSVSCVVSNSAGIAPSSAWNFSITAAPTAPYPAEVLADNPIGYWRLNEGPDNGAGNDGALCHDYVGGHNGIYTNVWLANANGGTGYNPITDPTVTATEFGEFGSVFYNGTYLINNYAGQIQGIDFATPGGSNAEFTVEAWANGHTYGAELTGAPLATKGIFGMDDQFNLGIDSTKVRYRFYVRDAAGAVHVVGSAGQGTLDGNWHHIAGVCDEANGQLLLYIDGQLVNTASIPTNSGIYETPEPMTIGAGTDNTTNLYDLQFDGYINDVAVYNHALSAGQVAAQYFAAGIAPSFVQAPPASVNANLNGTLEVSAKATGTQPLAYQWYDANTVSAIAGQTNSTLTVSNLTSSDTYYELVVTNLYGSTNAYVSVNVISGAPVLVQDLPARAIAPAGRSYTYSVQAQGAEPFTYTWYKDGSVIAGATGASYTFTAAVGTYQVAVSNSVGGVRSTLSTLTTVAMPTNAYATDLLGFKPVGYWPLQETTAPAPATIETNLGSLGALGNAYYITTNGSEMTFGQAGALTNTGDTDASVAFNGGSSVGYALVPQAVNPPLLVPPFTIECWANPPTGYGDMIGNRGPSLDNGGNGVQTGVSLFWEHNPQQFATWVGSGSGQNELRQSSTVTPGAWYHVVETCDANTNFTLYVDGTEDGSANLPYVPSSWNPLTIGGSFWNWKRAATPFRYFHGGLDEVAVYTNALTPAQIQTHYLAGTTAGSNYVQTVLADQPVLYYRMDTAGYTNAPASAYPTALNFGSLTAVQGAYQPGVLPGGVSGPSAPAFGTSSVAAPINGVMSCVDAGYAPAFTPTGNQPFTAMTWFRAYPADNRVQTIMGQGQNWALNLDGTTGNIVWTLYNAGEVTSTNVFNDNQWHFVAGVYDGANSYLYVDGALNNSAAAGGGLSGEPNAPLYLGGDSDFAQIGSGQQYFAGALAQAAYFTNALTAAQIQQIYSMAAPIVPTIRLTTSAGQLVITYTGTLLSSTNLAGPYSPVSGATSPYTVAPSGAQQFYRTMSAP